MRAPLRIAPFADAGIFVARSSNLPGVEVREANIRDSDFFKGFEGISAPNVEAVFLQIRKHFRLKMSLFRCKRGKNVKNPESEQKK